MNYEIKVSDGKKISVTSGERANIYNLVAHWMRSPMHMITSLTAEVGKDTVNLKRLTPEKEDPKTNQGELGLLGTCLVAVAPVLQGNKLSLGLPKNTLAIDNGRTIHFESDVECTLPNQKGNVHAIGDITIGQRVEIKAKSESFPMEVALAAAVMVTGMVLMQIGEKDLNQDDSENDF